MRDETENEEAKFKLVQLVTHNCITVQSGSRARNSGKCTAPRRVIRVSPSLGAGIGSALIAGNVDIQPCNSGKKILSVKEAFMHLHLCSQCRAVITVDEGYKCPNHSDHEEGLCDACALAQPGCEEIVYGSSR